MSRSRFIAVPTTTSTNRLWNNNESEIRTSEIKGFQRSESAADTGNPKSRDTVLLFSFRSLLSNDCYETSFPLKVRVVTGEVRSRPVLQCGS